MGNALCVSPSIRKVVRQSLQDPGIQELQKRFHLTENHLCSLYRTFKQNDTDNSETMNASEFHTLFKEQHRTIYLERLFEQHEITVDSELQFADFVRVVALFAIYEEADIIKFAFTTFDTNANGSIEKDEFARMIRILSATSTDFPTAMNRALALFDANSDGEMDLSEFAEMHLRFPHFLWPAFRLQFRLQECTLGMNEWKTIQRKVKGIQREVVYGARPVCFACICLPRRQLTAEATVKRYGLDADGSDDEDGSGRKSVSTKHRRQRSAGQPKRLRSQRSTAAYKSKSNSGQIDMSSPNGQALAAAGDPRRLDSLRSTFNGTSTTTSQDDTASLTDGTGTVNGSMLESVPLPHNVNPDQPAAPQRPNIQRTGSVASVVHSKNGTQRRKMKRLNSMSSLTHWQADMGKNPKQLSKDLIHRRNSSIHASQQPNSAPVKTLATRDSVSPTMPHLPSMDELAEAEAANAQRFKPIRSSDADITVDNASQLPLHHANHHQYQPSFDTLTQSDSQQQPDSQYESEVADSVASFRVHMPFAKPTLVDRTSSLPSNSSAGYERNLSLSTVGYQPQPNMPGHPAHVHSPPGTAQGYPIGTIASPPSHPTYPTVTRASSSFTFQSALSPPSIPSAFRPPVSPAQQTQFASLQQQRAAQQQMARSVSPPPMHYQPPAGVTMPNTQLISPLHQMRSAANMQRLAPSPTQQMMRQPMLPMQSAMMHPHQLRQQAAFPVGHYR